MGLTHEDLRIDVWHAERTRDERVCLSVRRWHGRWFLDVRIQYCAPDGTWRPTAKGVTFKPAHVAAFLGGLQRAADVLRTKVPAEPTSRAGEAA